METLSIGHFDVAFEQILVIMEFSRTPKIKVGFLYHCLSTSSTSLTACGRNIYHFPSISIYYNKKEEENNSNQFILQD